MVRRYKNEYGGKNLQEFCIKEKVSYTKMLHSLRNDSYRKPKHVKPAKVEQEVGLHPLVIEGPLPSVAAAEEMKPQVQKETKAPMLSSVELTLASNVRINLRDCNVSTLVCLIKEMEGHLC